MILYLTKDKGKKMLIKRKELSFIPDEEVDELIFIAFRLCLRIFLKGEAY